MPVTAPGIVYGRLWDTALRRGWRRDFIPPLSEGNKCRGTFDQPTPHAAPTSVRRRDATQPATPVGNLHFQPRDDRGALLPNNVAERIAAGG